MKIRAFTTLVSLSYIVYINFNLYFCLAGLRGEFTEAHYHGVTICNYESRANAADHKEKTLDSVGRPIQ